jgi:hypothetical protein
MNRPETHYAWNGDVSLAYQVLGQAGTDLLYLQGYCSNIDMNWESRHLAHFLRGLARHARLIITDRRGWGCSKRFTPGSVPEVDVLTDAFNVGPGTRPRATKTAVRRSSSQDRSRANVTFSQEALRRRVARGGF